MDNLIYKDGIRFFHCSLNKLDKEKNLATIKILDKNSNKNNLILEVDFDTIQVNPATRFHKK